MSYNNGMYKRVGHLEIEYDNGTIVRIGGDERLDFRFSGRKIGEIYSEFSVGVLGLSTDTINAMTVWDPTEALDKPRKIRVYGGYEKDGDAEAPLIFDGFVFEAIPTQPPERWLNIKCLAYNPVLNVIASFSESGTLERVFTDLCKKLNLKPNFSPRITDEIKRKRISFTISQPMKLQEVAAEFTEKLGMRCYAEYGVLNLDTKRPWQSEEKYQGGVVQEVNKRTGMIGVGNVSIAGINVTTRLSDSVPLLGIINLKTDLLPRANGKYMVISKTHSGHYRGQEWSTMLECIRLRNEKGEVVR